MPRKDIEILFPGGNDQRIKFFYVAELAVYPAPGSEEIGMERMCNNLAHDSTIEGTEALNSFFKAAQAASRLHVCIISDEITVNFYQ
jgi:hypothetical protein